MSLFQRLFGLFGCFIGLSSRIDRYLCPAFGSRDDIFRLYFVRGFALCAGLHMGIELDTLTILYSGYLLLCRLLPLLQGLYG